MSIFSALNISASGLTAERVRMDIIASNITNAEATRTSKGGPYIRKVVLFSEKLDNEISKNGSIDKKLSGVQVSKIAEDNVTPFKSVYNPSHPDADENGYVLMPNVNILNEMVDLITASRAFEANVTAINTEKQMYMKALEIGR